MFRGSGGQRRRATGAQRQRGSRFPAGTEKTRDARFAREGEREGARRRAPERGQRSYLPTALRSRPRPSSEKLGEYASTILSCGASVMGGEGVRRGIFTKTTDGKARVAKFRPSPRSADRVFRGATGELLPAETKTFPFDGSVGSFRFREIRKVAKCKLSREITQRLNPGVSRSSLNRSRWFTALGM